MRMLRRRRRRPVRLPIVTLLVWLGVFAAGYATVKPAPIPATTGTAVAAKLQLCGWSRRQNCVVDGDTIRLAGTTIRLADIDTPETGEPQCDRERRLGQRATRRLLELVNEGGFTVVRGGGRDTDIYGRKLRRIERHGRSLGDTLVAEGLARPWDGGRRPWC